MKKSDGAWVKHDFYFLNDLACFLPETPDLGVVGPALASVIIGLGNRGKRFFLWTSAFKCEKGCCFLR